MLVNDFLEQSARRSPDKIALIVSNQRYSYKDIDDGANSLANALVESGVKRSDRVGIHVENSFESVVSIFGVLKASGIFVMINPQVKSNKLAFLLNDCQIKVLITDSKLADKNSTITAKCSALRSIILTGNPDHLHTISSNQNQIQAFSFNELLNNYPSNRPDNDCVDNDLASLIYTSGSTGNPKGVMLTHLNVVSAASSIIRYLENTSDDIIINCLPLSFDYGLYQVLMAFKFGGTVVLERSFLYPYQIINVIQKEKVTGFPLVPTIVAILLQLKNMSKYDFSHLRYITSTAQAFPPEHIFKLQELYPKTLIYSTYGLTECKSVSYLPPDKISEKPDSVGIPMYNTEVYLVDETGKQLSKPGEIGELVVRGKNVMRGYWNRPEETAISLKPGSFPDEKVLYTGDIFKMDAEGYLFFIARKDDIIKTGGEKVSPKEIEKILYELLSVYEAAVIGIPDPILGQAIAAFIVLKKGDTLTKNDIILHCTKHLERYMVPKYVEFLKQLPKTSTGKISKKDLKNEKISW
jgi:amino acid adenylation domain-containing protein